MQARRWPQTLAGTQTGRTVDAESYPFLAATGRSQRVNLRHKPVDTIDTVRAIVRVVETRVHGVSGGVDPLAEDSVEQTVEIKQGAKIYVQGSDCRQDGDGVDWSPGGAKPGVGTTYTVTYERTEILQPTTVDLTGYTITGAVQGSRVLTTYR